jgi:hypothetical protein
LLRRTKFSLARIIFRVIIAADERPAAQRRAEAWDASVQQQRVAMKPPDKVLPLGLVEAAFCVA